MAEANLIAHMTERCMMIQKNVQPSMNTPGESLKVSGDIMTMRQQKQHDNNRLLMTAQMQH